MPVVASGLAACPAPAAAELAPLNSAAHLASPENVEILTLNFQELLRVNQELRDCVRCYEQQLESAQ